MRAHVWPGRAAAAPRSERLVQRNVDARESVHSTAFTAFTRNSPALSGSVWLSELIELQQRPWSIVSPKRGHADVPAFRGGWPPWLGCFTVAPSRETTAWGLLPGRGGRV